MTSEQQASRAYDAYKENPSNRNLCRYQTLLDLWLEDLHDYIKTENRKISFYAGERVLSAAEKIVEDAFQKHNK